MSQDLMNSKHTSVGNIDILKYCTIRHMTQFLPAPTNSFTLPFWDIFTKIINYIYVDIYDEKYIFIYLPFYVC